MAGLIELIITNPLADIEIAFSVAAGLAFLLFLRGFLSGLKQLSTIDENVEHLEHYRTRAIHGVTLLVVIFIAWEAFRWFIGLFV